MFLHLTFNKKYQMKNTKLKYLVTIKKGKTIKLGRSMEILRYAQTKKYTF